MKNLIHFLIGLGLVLMVNLVSAQHSSTTPQQALNTEGAVVNLTATQDLTQLANDLVNNYKLANPAAEIKLLPNNANIQVGQSVVSLFVDNESSVIQSDGRFQFVAGKQIFVPMFNSRNPMLEQINLQGISAAKFGQLLSASLEHQWSDIVKDGQKTAVRVYIPQGKEFDQVITNFAGIQQIAPTVIRLTSPEAVLAAIAKDPLAIGFTKWNSLAEAEQYSNGNQVRLLPIDKNGNGRMDYFEKIYGQANEFHHGVWIGKYPSALIQNVCISTNTQPVTTSQRSFLTWVLTNGQNELPKIGYIALTSSEREAGMSALTGIPANDQPISVPGTKSWPVYLTIALLLLLFTGAYTYSRRRAKRIVLFNESDETGHWSEQVLNVPRGLYFDKTHTWAFMEQDGNVRIGLDDFMQHVTGKVTRVSMKEPGEIVRKGETILALAHNGKQLHIYAPISGTILANNPLLDTDSSVINESPFFKGWIYQVEPKNWLRETQFMMMGDRYADWLKDEITRLKDFLSSLVRSEHPVLAHVVLQDGGELQDNLLAEMEPEVWEDFQLNFIDNSR